MIRHAIRSLFLTLLLAWTSAPGLAEELEQVQKDVKELAEALHRGEFDTVLRYTHPAIINLHGGYIATEAVLKRGMQPIIAEGLALDSFTFPGPPDYVEGEERRFAIVPTLSVISFQGQRVESLMFQFGVLEPGAVRWTYLDGSHLKPKLVETLFPDFPADYEFPETYRKRL